RDGRNRVLSESGGRGLAGNDVCLDRGHLIHPHDPEVGVSFLPRAAVAEIDFPMQRRREPPGDSALDLTFEPCEVDHQAAIHEARDAVNAKIAEITGDGDLGDLRDVALAEVRVQGHAAPPSPAWDRALAPGQP